MLNTDHPTTTTATPSAPDYLVSPGDGGFGRLSQQ
jgi:hypothetical protein